MIMIVPLMEWLVMGNQMIGLITILVFMHLKVNVGHSSSKVLELF